MVDIDRTTGPKPKPDYSELPQKPITLKKDIGGLAGPVGKRPESEESTSDQPSAAATKQTTLKKRGAPAGQWTLRGVSEAARETAAQAAKQEGIKLHEWLERAILQAAAPPSETGEPDNHLMETLEDIRNRLERIERENGLLYRFWQRFKAWFGESS
jgi:hypothetical protein